MNKEEFIKTLTGAGKLYDKELDEEAIKIWLSFFKDNTIEEFRQAMKEHIKTSRYFPTIADIKSKIYNIKNPNETNMELWDKLLEALGRSSYYAEEEFEKLPSLLKQYVGSPRQLQTIATEMTSEEIHSVYKGQFLKQIEALKENQKENVITNKNNILTNNEYIKIESICD